MNSSEQTGTVKVRRLCRQVEEVLALAIAGCGDEALLGVSVREVAPAPGPGRLLVTVEVPESEMVETLQALGRVQGFLRSEVASTIRRKRAPELLFRIALPDA